VPLDEPTAESLAQLQPVVRTACKLDLLGAHALAWAQIIADRGLPAYR
jgi:hypothetical protein